MTKLEDLKEGDTVKVVTGYLPEDFLKGVITKVTKTQITVRGSKYRRSSGILVGGGGWAFRYIEPFTKEDELALKVKEEQKSRKNLLEGVYSINPEDLTDEDVEILAGMVKKYSGK